VPAEFIAVAIGYTYKRIFYPTCIKVLTKNIFENQQYRHST